MTLFNYIYVDNSEFFVVAYEKLANSYYITENISESFADFIRYMNTPGVKSIANHIMANDFAQEYFRRNLDEIDPADIIKYYYIHVSNMNFFDGFDTIPLSFLSDEPEIRGNSLYLNSGSIKKLAIKYNENFEAYNDETD